MKKSEPEWDFMVDRITLKTKLVFKKPIKALWKTKEYDFPIKVTGILGEMDGIHYFSIEGSLGGVPENEVEFLGKKKRK